MKPTKNLKIKSATATREHLRVTWMDGKTVVYLLKYETTPQLKHHHEPPNKTALD